MVVHMRHDLGGSSAIVLHNVPVADTRGTGQRRREKTDVGTEVAGFGWRGVGELGSVGARADE